MRDKLVKDLGKHGVTALSYLTDKQYEEALEKIFNEEYLPEDFLDNPSNYKFVYDKKYTVNYRTPDLKETDPRYSIEIGRINFLNTFYTKVNEYNINNFVGFGKENPSMVFSDPKTPKYLSNSQIKFSENGSPVTSTINENGLCLYFPDKGAAGQVKTKEGATEYVTHEIKTPPIRASFVEGRFDITPEIRNLLISELSKAIQNNELIKKAISENKNYSITNIEIISSASNTYGGIVAPTHDIDGNPTGLQYNATQSNDGKIKYNGKFQINYDLANSRGLSLQNELSTNETLKNLLKLSPDVKFQISPRITDTGGRVDAPNAAKPGQYAKFVFTVSFDEKITTPGEGSGSVSFGNIVLRLTKQKSDYTPPLAYFRDLRRRKILKRGNKVRKHRRRGSFAGIGR